MGDYKEVVVYVGGNSVRFEKCWDVKIEGKLLTFNCNDMGTLMVMYFRLDQVAGWGLQQ